MTIILDIYLGPKWNFARNHLNISTYNDENFKPVFFFLWNDLQTTCITNKNITKKIQYEKLNNTNTEPYVLS